MKKYIAIFIRDQLEILNWISTHVIIIHDQVTSSQSKFSFFSTMRGSEVSLWIENYI